MKARLLTAIVFVLWAFIAFAQNNVGINTNSPVSLLDVRGNGINYDVFNVSKDKVSPLDSNFTFDKDGNVGLGTLSSGAYRLLSLGKPVAISPDLEIWQGHPSGPATFMLADINDVSGFNGCMNLYLLGNKKVQLQAQGTSYFTGGSLAVGITTPAALFDVAGQGISGDVMWAGNDKDITPDSAMILSSIGFLGLGTKFPQERLHVNGAVVLGQPTAAPAAGSIYYNGTNFFGWNGTTAKMLDLQQDGDWIVQAGGGGGVATNYNLCPGPVSVSAPGYVAPIPFADYGYLYVNNGTPPAAGVYQNLLLLDEITGNWNASQGFLISNWQGGGSNLQFAQGIDNGDQSFKITRAGTLLASAQGDGTTMVRYNPSGITDLPNQSRVRAFQIGMGYQVIFPSIWTPVNFTDDFSAPQGYDQQSEFTLAGTVNQPTPWENAFFTAQQDGFYQVNARCEFKTDTYTEDNEQWIPVTVNPTSYVSIAIYTGASPPVAGGANPYAIGNNLQIGYFYIGPAGFEEVVKLEYNNAPNVSDVVYLMANQTISIWVYHTANTPMKLIKGPEILYVSIHKVS